MPCTHDSFDANVDVIRLTDETDTVTGWTADIRIRCLECREPFVFIGAPIGLDANCPTVSPDGTELRAPIKPQSEAQVVDHPGFVHGFTHGRDDLDRAKAN